MIFDGFAGYKIGDKTGHVNIRFINRSIPGLYTTKPHGQHGYFDKTDTPVQNRTHKRRIFLRAPYMHFTNMTRSQTYSYDLKVPKRSNKFKYETGIPFPLDFYYPEVFFVQRPEVVPSPWERMNKRFIIKSRVLKPAKIMKNKLFRGKSGY